MNKSRTIGVNCKQRLNPLSQKPDVPQYPRCLNMQLTFLANTKLQALHYTVLAHEEPNHVEQSLFIVIGLNLSYWVYGENEKIG